VTETPLTVAFTVTATVLCAVCDAASVIVTTNV
jgi:hypothetical protein